MNQSGQVIFICDQTIKSFNDETGEIGSYSIVFGDEQSKDFHGNFFTKNTFLGHNRKENGGMDVGLLNHRVPLFRKDQFDEETERALKKISDIRFKNPVVSKLDDVGEYSKLVLDLSDKYEKMVYELAKKGVFKWSSGTAPQTYKALENGELEMFIPVEKSLTPMPAEYRMIQHRAMPLKAYIDFIQGSMDSGDYHLKTKNPFDIDAFIKSYSLNLDDFVNSMKGGKGSGHFGHKGRENLRGGSVASSGLKPMTYNTIFKKLKENKVALGVILELRGHAKRQSGGIEPRGMTIFESNDLKEFVNSSNLSSNEKESVLEILAGTSIEIV